MIGGAQYYCVTLMDVPMPLVLYWFMSCQIGVVLEMHQYHLASPQMVFDIKMHPNLLICVLSISVTSMSTLNSSPFARIVFNSCTWRYDYKSSEYM